MGEICNLSAGGDVPKGHFSKEKTEKYCIPIYSNGIDKNALYGWTDEARITNPCVTIAARGTIGYAALREEPFVPVVRLICAIPNKNVNVKYLKYAIDVLKFQVPASGIPQLTVPMLSKYKIPIPSLKEQERIVSILDRFDTLTNDITTGLPAEIEARRKQYEYYRNKLLAFKEAV
jgi:type I restriction enzyme S subunit